MRKTSVFKAHDEKNVAKVGDIVKIYHTRPLSKTKRWALAEVVQASKKVQGVEE
jgi:small subunit ribosomal protein S17